MEGRSAPRSVNYDNSLPLAIEGRAHRRQFFTQNGATYGSTTNNIVIMDINADSMLDVFGFLVLVLYSKIFSHIIA